MIVPILREYCDGEERTYRACTWSAVMPKDLQLVDIRYSKLILSVTQKSARYSEHIELLFVQGATWKVRKHSVETICCLPNPMLQLSNSSLFMTSHYAMLLREPAPAAVRRS